MKKLLGLSIAAMSLAIATLTGAPSTDAPPAAPAAKRAALRHAKMGLVAEKLGLTEAQKAQAKQIRTATVEAVKGIRENQALTPEQKHAQIAATTQAARGQWQALLTPEQQTKLAEIKNHPRLLNAFAVRRVRMAALADRLELTSAQRTQMHEAQSKAHAAMKVVRADTTLTVEQKKAKAREISQASRAEMRGLLTPEQSAKLDQIRL